jgi:transcriptional regulator with XRE-family HTH domain
MTKPRLGAVLRRLRRKRDITQVRLARLARIDQGHLSQLETGKRANPSGAILVRLARALDVEVTELLS